MATSRKDRAVLVSWILVASLVGGSAVATALLGWLGDWSGRRWGLTLTLRIVWGCCLVACLAVGLTHVTIFGWRFRRYPVGPKAGEPRAVAIPWYKSGGTSFAITVVLVSLFGSAVVATAVLWILGDVLGAGVLGLVLKIIWGSWWVLCIIMVLVRIAIFRWQMLQARRANRGGDPCRRPWGRC
jgi:hypothetical protein